MTAITANAVRAQALGDIHEYPVLGSTHLYVGEMVVLDSSGYAKSATAAASLISVGVCVSECDNSSGASGAKNVKVRKGSFVFAVKSGDEPTIAEVGDVVYFTDNNTVQKTAGSSSVAGVLTGFEGSDAIVSVGLWPLQVGLLAANNLSDVGTAATARANIGANEFQLGFTCSDLVAANAKRFGFCAPRAFTITRIKSVLLGHALAAGDCTLTAKIAGVAVTTGVITITQSGSAIGDLDTCSPSAANVVAADQFVEVLVGGANTDTAAQAYVTVYGTY
jgi:hypothetical protein